MKNLSLLLMGAVAIALGHAPSARADDVGLSFGEEPAVATEPAAPEAIPVNPDGPLALPPKTKLPPVQPFSWKDKELPPPPPGAIAQAPTVDRSQPFTSDGFQVDTAATAESPSETPQASHQPAERQASENTAANSSPEPVELTMPTQTAIAPAVPRLDNPTPASVPGAEPANPAAAVSGSVESAAIATVPVATSPELSFVPEPLAEKPVELAFDRSSVSTDPAEYTLDHLFRGGSNSVVARTVGSAEGTRTSDGLRTKAYYGHSDPGNGVWNLGSFSYQHGANSPEEADKKQLRRLENQSKTLREQAVEKGLTLSLEEKLNGIDLANQSPRAALSRGGYIDRLLEARTMGLVGEEAVLWARTRSYLDPDTQRWNAPGLGNTASGVSHDQERRMRAIARALTAYQQENPSFLVSETPAQPNQAPSDSRSQQVSWQSSQPKASTQPASNSPQGSINGSDARTNLLEQAIDRLMNLDLT